MSSSFHLAIPAGDLKKEVYEKIKANIELNKIKFIDKPYTRFKGTEFEQNTFFVEDPNFNVLEIKSMAKYNPLDFEVHGVGC